MAFLRMTPRLSSSLHINMHTCNYDWRHPVSPVEVQTLLSQASCTCFGPGDLTHQVLCPGPKMEEKENTGSWGSTRNSLIPRPWIQDIEGANAKELCNVSSAKARSIVPGKPCKQVQIQPNTVNTLACPLLSNLATRLWLHNGAPVNASASCRVLPTGDLLLVGSQQRLGVFQCWSLEEGFRQLVASYCPEVMEDGLMDQKDQRDGTPVIINTSRVSAPAGDRASWGADKSYWNEFLVMCTLFGLAVVLLVLFFLYRHRDGMKLFLKQGECASVHPKTRPVVLPPETRPLNGVGPPSNPLDHRGYQALSDSSPGARVFTESEKRPLSIQDSFVEVSPVCPRPRVRLGSEIRDSVV